MCMCVWGGGKGGNQPVHTAGIQLRKMPVSSTSCMLGSCYKVKSKKRCIGSRRK